MKKFNKIFVCGISRTGTKSLGDFLEKFDLKVVHNGGRVFNPMQLDQIDIVFFELCVSITVCMQNKTNIDTKVITRPMNESISGMIPVTARPLNIAPEAAFA